MLAGSGMLVQRSRNAGELSRWLAQVFHTKEGRRSGIVGPSSQNGSSSLSMLAKVVVKGQRWQGMIERLVAEQGERVVVSVGARGAERRWYYQEAWWMSWGASLRAGGFKRLVGAQVGGVEVWCRLLERAW